MVSRDNFCLPITGNYLEIVFFWVVACFEVLVLVI
jgi:hypothetical protein